MKSALKEKRRNARRFLGNREPLKENMPKARITEGLPGNFGDFAVVCKGEMEGRKEPVAVKISRYIYSGINEAWEKEFETSRKLSMLLPNVASYHSMVDVQGQPSYPAFAMEIVLGFPILDRNMDCLDAGRFRGLLSKRSVEQLASSLEIAASSGWSTYDLQYFMLLEDQTLNGKERKKGDLILFDFWHWKQTEDRSSLNFEAQISRLAKLAGA